MKFFALASVAAAFAIYAPSPLKSCGTSQDAFVLNFLDLNPYPVTKGGNVTVKAAGILNKDITQGASVSLTVKAGFIPLYSTTVDLCDNASEQGMACPIPKGPQNIETTQMVLDLVPAGTFKIKIVATNADKSPLACFEGNVIIQDLKNVLLF